MSEFEQFKITLTTVQMLARQIKAVVINVGGVLLDNRQCDAMPELRFRSHFDGQGISLLRAIGIKIALVFSEKAEGGSMIKNLVNRWNSLPSTQKQATEGGWQMVTLIDEAYGQTAVEKTWSWLNEINVSWEECAVLANDLPELPLLEKAGLRVAHAAAEQVIKDRCYWVTPRPGGNGAIRDLANLILKARDIDPATLPTR
jgi:3-deoxy-D-manno-octulosonate 8-phosphate phosphatase (KDO 8-P phosphatase)